MAVRRPTAEKDECKRKFQLPWLAALLYLALIFPGCGLVQRLLEPKRYHFVHVEHGAFYVNAQPFRFIGANVRLLHGRQERAMVEEALAGLQSLGVRVVRQWAVGECAAENGAPHRPISAYYLQAGPNNWQEESFRQLDLLLDAARRHKIKVIITLLNNWSDYGGMPMYVYWAGLAATPLSPAAHDSFYTNSQVRGWVRAYIEKLVFRKNTANGRLYRDDPTIFSWELANEAGAAYTNLPLLVEWVRQTSAFLKNLDPNHLLGVSLTRYSSRGQRRIWQQVMALPDIDYCDFHFYPDRQTWQSQPEFALEHLDDAAQLAKYRLGKPLILGEVGYPAGPGRERFFAQVFRRSASNGIDGVLVWSYSIPDWRDDYAINWREPGTAPLCSLIARHAAGFGRPEQVEASNPHIGPAFADSLRIHPQEQRFTRPAARPELRGATLRYTFSPENFARAKWWQFGFWEGGGNFAHAYGSDDGYFKYAFALSRPETLRAAHLSARLSAEFPGAQGPPEGISDILVALNGRTLGSLRAGPDDSVGRIFTVAADFTPNGGLYLPAGENFLSFTVPPGDTAANGICLYGRALQDSLRERQQFIVLELERMPAVQNAGN